MRVSDNTNPNTILSKMYHVKGAEEKLHSEPVTFKIVNSDPFEIQFPA